MWSIWCWASFIWCLKVTNLYYIAVLSISIPCSKLQNRYLIYLENLSIFARCRCWSYYKRGEWLLHTYRCVAKNGSLMFLSPWGKFFISLRSPFSARFYLFSVRHFCRLRLETNSTKTLFLVLILRTVFCCCKKKWNKYFTIQTCLVITCFSRCVQAEMFQ